MSLDLKGYSIDSTRNTVALLLNNIPILYPSATASVQMQSGKNVSLGGSVQATRAFVLTKPPVTPAIHSLGDIVIDSENDLLGRSIFQVQHVPPVPQGNGQAALQTSWTRIGKFTSPAATLATAVTLNGGTSTDIETAIVEAGRDGQVVLTGSFTLTRPIRLEGVLPAGQVVTFIMSNPTFTGFSSLALATTAIGPTPLPAAQSWLNNGVYLTTPFDSSFWSDLLQNASFAL